MPLKEQIETDIKQAMRAKDQDSLRALRSLKSMILLGETEKGADGELKEQGREDLAAKEQAELDVINRYLPQPLSEEELQQAIEKIVQETGATGMQDMGKVMGQATAALAGKADGKAISTVVRQVLASK